MSTPPPHTIGIPNAIFVAGLTKSYGSHVVVDSVDFAVPEGSITGLVGSDGAGKSTTIRMILGLVPATAGTVLIEGGTLAELDSPGRTVGAVLDGFRFTGSRSVRSHLRVYSAAIGVPDREVDRVLDLVGLTPLARERASRLIPDRARRLMIATAMLGRPRILILDQPTSGLEPAGIDWLFGFLRRFTADGGTVLLSGDDIHEFYPIVDSLVVLNRGRTGFVGTIDEAEQLTGVRTDCLVGCSNPRALEEFAGAHGIPTTRIPDGRVRLEGISRSSMERLAADAGVRVFALTAIAPGIDRIVTMHTRLDGSGGTL